MPVLDIVLASCSLAYWGGMMVLVLRLRARIPALAELNAPAPARWPKVSVVVPARNEAHTLVPALRSKVETTYPDLEVVLVDDRSVDATPRLANTMAKEYPRLRVLRVDTLPEGWQGKVHAMRRGVECSSGEWLLFCDADVHLEPSALRRVVAYAEHERADHVTMLPRMTVPSRILACTLLTFLRQLSVGGRLGRAADPKSSAYAGIGAFNMVRRDALARIQGFSSLSAEINDDIALGRKLKRAGASQRVLNGADGLSLEFVPSYRAFAQTLEKNGGTVRCLVVVLGVTLLAAVEGGLVFGLLSGSPLPMALGVLAWLCGAMATFRAAQWLKLPRWPAAVPFLGVLPLAWALARASVLAWWRGGVTWRGRFYRQRTGGRPTPAG